MAPSTRTQNALIGGLAALAVGASAFAVWSVNRPHPSLEDVESVATPTRPSDPGPATTTADKSDVAESEGGPEDTGSATGPRSTQPTVDEWVEAWSDEAELLVIGDGYSNLPTQWVQVWAGSLGDERPVQIHHWGEAEDVAFNDPIVLSDTGDEPLTVWSASRAGSTVEDAAERYDDFVDASAKPDAVLVSLGLSSADEDIKAGLDALVEEIDDDIPVLVLIGPEGLYEEGVGDAIQSWVEDNEDRVSVVDLRDVAPESPDAEQWARAFQRSLES